MYTSAVDIVDKSIQGRFKDWGYALYLALGSSTFFRGGSIVRQVRASPELAWAGDLPRMLQVSLATFAVSGAFLSRDFLDLAIHVVAIMILIGTVVKAALAGDTPERRPETSAQPAL